MPSTDRILSKGHLSCDVIVVESDLNIHTEQIKQTFLFLSFEINKLVLYLWLLFRHCS